MPRQQLSKRDLTRLQGAEQRIERARANLREAERDWAGLVRELGQAAVARRMGVSPQALSDRLRWIERRSGA